MDRFVLCYAAESFDYLCKYLVYFFFLIKMYKLESDNRCIQSSPLVLL